MNYAEKNKGIITFHKLQTFIENPALYNVLYNDLKGIEEKKDCFVIGQAVEDFVYGETEKYEVVAQRSQKPTDKIQLTKSQGALVAGSSELLLGNQWTIPDGKKTRLSVSYGSLTLGGEMDDFARGENSAIIGDYKTAASYKSFMEYKDKYLDQLAYYQFLVQAGLGIDAKYIHGRIKLVLKDVLVSIGFRVSPQTLLERRAHLIEALDRVEEAHKNNDFPELSDHDYFTEKQISHLWEQKELIELY